jgi:hypothetical protein
VRLRLAGIVGAVFLSCAGAVSAVPLAAARAAGLRPAPAGLAGAAPPAAAGRFTRIWVPGAIQTMPEAITDTGLIVGCYQHRPGRCSASSTATGSSPP